MDWDERLVSHPVCSVSPNRCQCVMDWDERLVVELMRVEASAGKARPYSSKLQAAPVSANHLLKPATKSPATSAEPPSMVSKIFFLEKLMGVPEPKRQENGEWYLARFICTSNSLKHPFSQWRIRQHNIDAMLHPIMAPWVDGSAHPSTCAIETCCRSRRLEDPRNFEPYLTPHRFFPGSYQIMFIDVHLPSGKLTWQW